ncbi:hypothetical protein C6558_32160 [Ensifer sp. NM-2]|uniref:hypothetical protein n=1 Tax=Ensifer sp. NM-2 TaxID=2109730 RepID=UPI000D137F11|nr:hypothetical protein [Ensifer sp. NM-2]PSS60633.1 hypothetical protein C6558_32160 [Ensifer sp. NM-2]
MIRKFTVAFLFLIFATPVCAGNILIETRRPTASLPVISPKPNPVLDLQKLNVQAERWDRALGFSVVSDRLEASDK